MADIQALPWTGERLVPEYTGSTALEHLHRYAFSRDFIMGKAVLDIASGEGYGAKMLALHAGSVIGVDISEEAIEHARARYGDAVDFRVGSCTAIPIDDSSVDVVNSFETLEHIVEHDKFFTEIRRVLRPGGILVLSTPDKLHYTIGPRFANEYHLRELSKEEFGAVVRRNFRNVVLFEQSIVSGSIIAPSTDVRPSGVRHYLGDFSRLTHTDGVMEAPYLIAVATDGELPIEPRVSLFKGWDLPTEEEKLLEDARTTLARERGAAEQRNTALTAQNTLVIEQISAAHRSAVAAMEMELARLRKEVETIGVLQAEIARLGIERERLIVLQAAGHEYSSDQAFLTPYVTKEARIFPMLAEIAERMHTAERGTKPPIFYKIYQDAFIEKSFDPRAILEVGVHLGDSTKILATAYPEAKIVGADLNIHQIDFSNYPNIIYLQADQSDKQGLESIINQNFPNGIDLVIDDASHIGSLSRATFDIVFPLLRSGGFYIIEDWGTGYWNNFVDGGRYQEFLPVPVIGDFPRRLPSHDFGMVGFVKSLVDYTSEPDIRATESAPATRTSRIKALHFHAGVCIVEKS